MSFCWTQNSFRIPGNRRAGHVFTLLEGIFMNTQKEAIMPKLQPLEQKVYEIFLTAKSLYWSHRYRGKDGFIRRGRTGAITGHAVLDELEYRYKTYTSLDSLMATIRNLKNNHKLIATERLPGHPNGVSVYWAI